MWIATTLGFYSVVSSGRRNQVMVRARVKKDLISLKRRFKMRNMIHYCEKADYQFRIITSLYRWMRIAAHLARDTASYRNFKYAVEQVDPVRADTYLDVWQSLIQIETEEIRSIAKKGLKSLQR